MERAGIDIITDGEIHRESYSNRLATPRRRAAWHCGRSTAGLDGFTGPTALHLCLGYAYVARDKPNRYSFLSELTGTVAQQISIEAAQPNLDLRDLDHLGDKKVIFGVVSMGDPEAETPEIVAGRIRRALEHAPPERLIPAPDCGMKYIPRYLAFAKLKALAEGAGIARRELTAR